MQGCKVAQKVKGLIVFEPVGWAIFLRTTTHLRKSFDSLSDLSELFSSVHFVLWLTGRGLVWDICWYETCEGVDKRAKSRYSTSPTLFGPRSLA